MSRAARAVLTLQLLVIALLLAAAIWSKGPPAPGPGDACQAVTFEGARFVHCIAVPGRHRIETAITGSDGILYRGFARLAADQGKAGVAFAVNGGMYDVRSRPIGYYAQGGARLYPVNRREGSGNFYLKPGGIFFGAAAGPWRVMTTDDFTATVDRRPDFGTQSGPMLLIGGRIHPRFSTNGASAKVRNGVGIDTAGRAHFVLSDDPVSFGRMARFMRDVARTPDALFLDGTVSALWHPATGRMDARYPLGPLIVVREAGTVAR